MLTCVFAQKSICVCVCVCACVCALVSFKHVSLRGLLFRHIHNPQACCEED